MRCHRCRRRLDGNLRCRRCEFIDGFATVLLFGGALLAATLLLLLPFIV